MQEFSEIWEDLKVKDLGLRFEFELNSFKFRINKGEGLTRRLVACERLLNRAVTDPNGIASGEHDSLIDSIMLNVSQMTNDGEDKIDFDSDWREKIVGKMSEDIQIDMLLNLPYSVAAVILGEKRAAVALGEGLISLDSTNQAADQ